MKKYKNVCKLYHPAPLYSQTLQNIFIIQCVICRPRKRRVGDDLQVTGGKVIKMGNPELTKLWNINPNNMEACKTEDRLG